LTGKSQNEEKKKSPPKMKRVWETPKPIQPEEMSQHRIWKARTWFSPMRQNKPDKQDYNKET
jgi:hypothetical protein